MVDLDELKVNGWTEIDGITSDEEIIALASTIGSIIPHPNGEELFTLVPKDGSTQLRGTFSQKYGYSKFPLHTDTAFWVKPARYIVLGMLNKSSCNTVVLNMKSIIHDLGHKGIAAAKSAIYELSTFEGKRYTSVHFQHDNESGFRFDPNCMRPKNRDALYFHNKIIERFSHCDSKPIQWTGQKAVVIDNWNVVHGRDEVVGKQRNRKLVRVYVG